MRPDSARTNGQLLHAESLEEGIVSTVMSGGDTDTNAAIAGALLGAVWGRGAVPMQWLDRIMCCRPISGIVGVKQPRPEACRAAGLVGTERTTK